MANCITGEKKWRQREWKPFSQEPACIHIHTRTHTPWYTLSPFQSVYNLWCLSCSAGCFTTCIWMPTGVHPSLSDSAIKDDTHNEGSFQASGGCCGGGERGGWRGREAPPKTATALQALGAQWGAEPRWIIRDYSERWQTEQKQTIQSVEDEKSFGLQPETEYVLSMFVCLQEWPGKRRETKKKRGGGVRILMKP